MQLNAFCKIHLFQGILAIAMGSPALAVILGDRSVNNTAPTGSANFPIENVGFVQNGAAATATYIGNGWAIGADHAFGAINDVMLDGVLYEWDQSVNGGTGYHSLFSGSSEMDIRLFKLIGDVHVTDINVASSPVNIGEQIEFGGTGSTGSWNDMGTTATGDDVFGWPGTRIIGANGAAQTFWGTNTISNTFSSFFGGPRFQIDFSAPDDPTTTPFEAQGGNGDSGAGAFVQRNGQWELAGMLVDVQNKSGQSSSYGHTTTFLDLTEFHDQIQQCIIPEPSGALLGILGLFLLGGRRRR